MLSHFYGFCGYFILPLVVESDVCECSVTHSCPWTLRLQCMEKFWLKWGLFGGEGGDSHYQWFPTSCHWLHCSFASQVVFAAGSLLILCLSSNGVCSPGVSAYCPAVQVWVHIVVQSRCECILSYWKWNVPHPYSRPVQLAYTQLF
jgi:hypothetical protein